MDKLETRKIITDFLKQREEVIFAYIFGSFVRNDRYHDVDVAICLDRNFDRKDLSRFPYGYESLLIGRLTGLVGKNIDLVVMNDAEILMQQRVVNKGVLLFSRDDRFRVQYENNVRRLFIDSEHLRNIRESYMDNRIEDLTKRIENA